MPEPADETTDDADFEALLDAFREPDDPPRRKTAGLLWIVLAIFSTASAFWLAARVSLGGTAENKQATPVVALPTKVAERAIVSRDGTPRDVVEDYLERCRRGMTAREVRWIAEDFQKAGLDLGLRAGPPEEFIRQRTRQHAWYLDLLADGLGLAPDQRAAAEAKLAGLLEEAAAEFREKLEARSSEPFEHDGGRFQLVDGAVIRRLIETPQWLADERYAPWELCELTEEQLDLTWFEIFTNRGDPGDGVERSWLDAPSTSQVAHVSGNARAGDASAFPLSPTHIGPGGEEFVRSAAAILPLSPGAPPARPVHESPLVHETRRFHPAQLKTLILLRPELAAELLESPEQIAR